MQQTSDNPASPYSDLFCSSEGIYLLSHSVGRPLLSTPTYLNDCFIAPWKAGHPWPQWLASIERFRSALAHLFNSSPALFCPQTNLSSALTKIIYSFPFIATKPVILLSEKDFPSISFVCKKAEEKGYRLRFIPKEKDHTDAAIWRNYLKSDVRFAIMTHIHSNTGHRIPLETIVSIAKENAILSIVDVAQSAGIIPVDLARIQPDILIGSCVKWLCGGPGAGFLWMQEQLITQAEPIDIGWFSHQNPFEFDTHHFAYSKDASRFMGGTPSIAPYIVAEHSINQLLKIGISTIKAHNQRLSETLLQRVDNKYLITPHNAEKRGGTLVFNFKHHQKAVVTRLTQANVLFDERPTGLRLSFHLYNTVEEAHTVARCINP